MAKKNKLNIKGKIGKIDQSKDIKDSEIESEILNEDIDNDITAESLDEFDQSIKVEGSKVKSKTVWIITAVGIAIAGIITALIKLDVI